MPGLLYHSPARIVAELLIHAGYGTDPERTIGGNWPVYVGKEPDEPDEIIKVSFTQGRDFGDTADNERQEWHGIQVMVRSLNEEEGFYKIQRIALFLDQVHRTLVDIAQIEEAGTGTTEYVLNGITRTTNVLPLGSESPQSQRQLFTVNAVAVIRLCC